MRLRHQRPAINNSPLVNSVGEQATGALAHQDASSVAAIRFEATPPPLQTLIPAEAPLCTLYLASCYGGEVSPVIHHRLKNGSGNQRLRRGFEPSTALRRSPPRHPALFLSLRSKPLYRSFTAQFSYAPDAGGSARKSASPSMSNRVQSRCMNTKVRLAGSIACSFTQVWVGLRRTDAPEVSWRNVQTPTDYQNQRLVLSASAPDCR
jgi:hypothetical protein